MKKELQGWILFCPTS